MPTDRAHEAVLSFEYADERRARLVAASVGPEAGDIDGDRTGVTVDRRGATLDLTVSAADLVALRAGLNTWLTLVTVAEDCGRVTD